MAVLTELQHRVHALTGGLFANWLPPDRVEVGDYGVIRGDRFQRDGNLRNWNVSCRVETTKTAAGRLEYSDRAQIQAALRTRARIAGQRSPSLTAKIDFRGEGAFLYHLAGITSHRLEDFGNSTSFSRANGLPVRSSSRRIQS